VIVMDGRRVDLARARREAKALLSAARAGDAAARERVLAARPAAADADALRLADAQLAVARELGARSWPALVRDAQARAMARGERARTLVEWATSGRRDGAETLLALDPGLAREALDAALVLGDNARVVAALADDRGAASRALGVHGWEPLLYVAYSAFLGDERTDGLVACAEALLGAGADPNAAREDDGYGRMTALHGAAGLAHEPRMTALLLDAGADPDDGRSLRSAAGAADPACLELLLEAGARVYGAMALAHAAQRGSLRTARLLLERGPRQWGERENALQWAVRPEASEEILWLLVEHGAELEASFDGSGRTPYGVAVRSGRGDLAELLASLGAQRRAEPLDELVGACLAADGPTARRLAAEHPEAVRLLRTAEAGLIAGWAANGRREAVEVLLDLGVPVDARGPGGLTALQEATACDDPELVALLLERGADPGKRAPVDGPHDGEPPRGADPGKRAPVDGPHDGEPPRGGRGRATTGRRREADEPPYGELGWVAEEAYLRLLAGSPLAATRPCGDGIAAMTGVDSNSENGVACSRIDGDVEATIADTLRWLTDHDAPAQWLLADPVAPSDLRERLVAAGAQPERSAVVMGAVLDRLALGDPLPAGFEIVAVRDEAALRAWAEVVEPAEPRARAVEVLASLGLGADAPLQHRLARSGGEVLGAASFLLHGETVLGRELTVVAPERRGGIGRALVQAGAREAIAAGARVALVGPTPDTVAFYRLLGFALRPWPRDRSFYLPLPRG
jgi:ankyrin repeat protein/GNAT superfamily N-acetyltransferase